METWLIDRDMDDYDHRRNQPKIDYGPMGPNHPGWLDMCHEVEHQLHMAGRIIDDETVEAIAINDSLWKQLLQDVRENSPVRNAQVVSQIFSRFLSNVRENAESDQGLDSLFGGDTTITPQNPF